MTLPATNLLAYLRWVQQCILQTWWQALTLYKYRHQFSLYDLLMSSVKSRRRQSSRRDLHE